MEDIRQAVERAKAYGPREPSGFPSSSPRHPSKRTATGLSSGKQIAKRLELSAAYLQSRRIIAYDGRDPRTRAFDILRTEVLRSMDLKGWRSVAVTSPTPGCGKTLTAVNLALSAARQAERRVRLVDLDLRKPQVATTLGLNCAQGVLSVLRGEIDVEEAIIEAGLASSQLELLPTAASPNSSDLVGSAEMKNFLQAVSAHEQSRIVIFDLPPLLTGHDVISVLPQVDCVLLVAAVGTSTVSEIERCGKYLQAAELVRFVLNKAPESATTYPYY